MPPADAAPTSAAHRRKANSDHGGRPGRLLTKSGVVVAILIAAAAVIVHGSFRGSSRVETPSTLLADHSLWGSRIRLAGFVGTGSVKPRPGGVQFAIEDEGGTGRVTVHYAGDIPNELRGGRVVDVTGAFDGREFEAQPNTLVAICGRSPRQEHC